MTKAWQNVKSSVIKPEPRSLGNSSFTAPLYFQTLYLDFCLLQLRKICSSLNTLILILTSKDIVMYETYCCFRCTGDMIFCSKMIFRITSGQDLLEFNLICLVSMLTEKGDEECLIIGMIPESFYSSFPFYLFQFLFEAMRLAVTTKCIQWGPWHYKTILGSSVFCVGVVSKFSETWDKKATWNKMWLL